MAFKIIESESEKVIIAKAEKAREIESSFNYETQKGFSGTNGYFYACAEKNQIDYNSFLELLDPNDDASTLPVTCMNEATGEWEDVAHNYKQMKVIVALGAKHVFDLRVKRKHKLELVDSCTTLNQVNGIIWQN